jgi:hypothetical protein
MAMGVGPLATHPGPFRLRADDGYAKYATADGISFRDPIDAEQLLKAADALDNASYWADSGTVTVTEPEAGVFRLTKGAVAYQGLYQAMINWIPPWVGTVSMYFEARAGTIDNSWFNIRHNDPTNTSIITDVEKISGAGSISAGSGFANVTNLDGEWSKFRATGTLKGKIAGSTDISTWIWVGGDGTTAGYIEVRNLQVVLGDTAKPRPTQTDPDDWMMAYRPHNRVTKDGAARYSVVDTEGLVSCGEALDYVAGASDTGTHESKVYAPFWFTWETGKYCNFWLSYSSAGGQGGIRIRATSGGDLYVSDREDGAGSDLAYEASFFTDGVLYQGAATVDTSTKTVTVVIAGQTIYSGSYTNASVTTSALIENDLASDDSRMVLESYPRKATGIIVAGGKASPAYGDPGLWLTEPDGSAFDVDAGDAVMYTAKTFVAGKLCRGGFDSNTTTSPANPFWQYEANNLYAASDETPQTWTAGTTKSFMQLLRSDTHGSQFLIHDSAKQWKRFNVNDDAIPAASAYPAISNYNAALYITNFALLDLSSLHEAEFCEVTDTKTNPVSGTEFNHDAGAQLNCTFTYETGKLVSFKPRWVDNDNQTYVYAQADGKLRISNIDDGDETTHVNSAGYFSDGVEYRISIEVVGTYMRVCINETKVFEGAAGISERPTATGGIVLHSLATNDLVITTHPYPALGGNLGATDRVVCPQQSDTANCFADAIIITRDVTLPGGGEIDVNVRIDDTDEISCQINDTGRDLLYENATARITGAASSVSNGDDVMWTLDGADAEVFSNGSSDGSGSLALLGGSGALVESMGGPAGGADALELWPLYVNLFKL